MFRKRWNVITFAGIRIGIDLSWLLIAVLLTWTLAVGHFPFSYPGLAPKMYWLMGFLGMIGLFVCIVLHELGHALVAKYFKLPISQITLFLFGGVAEIKKEPQSPKVEFWVAIAGPIVTCILTAILFAVTYFGQKWNWSFMLTGITSYLTVINMLILFFNLIPAFPLDGGRILRAILWKCKNNLEWATKVTTRLGSGFALFLIFFGLFSFIAGNFIGGIWLTILGLFLYRASFASQTQFYIGQTLRDAKISSFMTKQIETVPPQITVQTLLDEHMYKSHHHLYPVVEQDKFLGYVSLQEIKTISQDRWGLTSVESIMVPLSKSPTIPLDIHAMKALSIIQELDVSTLFVIQGSHLEGLVTSQDLFKLIYLKIELEGGNSH